MSPCFGQFLGSFSNIGISLERNQPFLEGWFLYEIFLCRNQPSSGAGKEIEPIKLAELHVHDYTLLCDIPQNFEECTLARHGC